MTTGWPNPLRPWKKAASEQIAFYVTVPISVFIHELFHAFAVWAFGGRIVEFGFFFFWGYVLPDRVFPALWQEWVVSFMGTVGSMLFGVTWWLIFGRNDSSSMRYLARRVLRFQIYFALIYYPIFTAVLRIGDWRVIYDFNATPVLAGVTAVAHVLILLWAWRLDRAGWFDALAFTSERDQQAHDALRESADSRPEDVATQLAYVDSLLTKGSQKEALQYARSLVEKYPNSAESHLAVARAQWTGSDHVPRDVLRHAQQAQQIGLTNPNQIAFAHNITGTDALGRGKFDAALADFDLGLAVLPSADESRRTISMRAQLHQMKSAVFAQQSRNQAALVEIQHAIHFAERSGQSQWVQQLRQRQQLLEQRL